MTRFPLAPGSTIGVLGGGQLGRMLALAAARLSFDVGVLTPELDSCASRGAARTLLAEYDEDLAAAKVIRKRLRLFADAHVDQVILLNQAGKTSHQDICDSLDLFAREVMPEFHAGQAAQDAWKQGVLAERIVLEDLDTEQYDLYAHQNEDIVRLTPEQLKQRMAEKDRLTA